MSDKILHNPFYTDSAHKAYEQALCDLVDWLVKHNKVHEVTTFLLAYPFMLSEDDYWALRTRVNPLIEDKP